MAVLNNAINANAVTPLPPVDGGLGVSNPTAHGVLVAEGAAAVALAPPPRHGPQHEQPIAGPEAAGAGRTRRAQPRGSRRRGRLAGRSRHRADHARRGAAATGGNPVERF